MRVCPETDRLSCPAVGYRIDCDGQSVLISGDTRCGENVIRYGKGADGLIHEVGCARDRAASMSGLIRGRVVNGDDGTHRFEFPRQPVLFYH
jgi:hypothetical protein